MAYETPGKPIEWYNAQEALDSIRNAPSTYAAQAIFRLLKPEVQVELRRAVHALRGEQGR